MPRASLVTLLILSVGFVQTSVGAEGIAPKASGGQDPMQGARQNKRRHWLQLYDQGYILIAAHVVGPDLQSEFFTNPNVPVSTTVVNKEGDEPTSLAMLMVQGKENLVIVTAPRYELEKGDARLLANTVSIRRNGNAMYGGRTIGVMTRWAMLCILLMFSVGCSTHFSTLQPEGSTAQILYAIPEEQAFQIAHGTLVTTIPDRKIEIIEGPIRGYSTYTQPFLDKYTQQVFVFPAEGLDALGKKIRGYYFEVSGSGTSGIGYSINVELFKKVTEAAKATGKGIAVTGVERTDYTNAEWHNAQGVPVKSKSPAESLEPNFRHSDEVELSRPNAEQLKSAVVKITAKPSGGSSKVGTGFIVRLDEDVAYVVTAAHVVAGDPQPKVEFFMKRNLPVLSEVLGLEGDDEMRGLALLVVRGPENLPKGLSALPLSETLRFVGGEDIMVIGFPGNAGPWAVVKGNISSRQGRDLYFSPSVDSGHSGGPIIQKGKVVGLVTVAGQSSGRGVIAQSIHDYVEGYGITVEGRP
jgi:hypothetical protein